MKILFWVPYPTEGASNRYRVEQYLSYLKGKDVEYSLHPFWGTSAYKILYNRGSYFKKIYYFILGVISRIFDLIKIWGYDVVFIHRESWPVAGAFFETILVLMKKPIIFDFDDAIFLSSSSKSNSFFERFKGTKKVFSIIKKSRHVIAGNRYLADFALSCNNSVSVIPTVIDTDRYYGYNSKESEEVVIGWIGSVTTLDFLNMMRPVFIQLANGYRNLRFKAIGGNFIIDGISDFVESKPWVLEEEIEDLKSLDIGIMPMPENRWTKGKCGFKAIVYMSMGIPCVCSPVGVNKEIIADGVNGFLAATEEEWIEKLSLLIKDNHLRRKLGAAGRKTVEEKYSVKVNAPKFLKIIEDVYGVKGK